MIKNNKIRFDYLWRYLKNKIPFVNVSISKYYLGKTDLNIDEFEKRLIEKGYQYNYFSYTEKGQVSNMRKLYINIVNGIEEIRQIHIRLFNDNNIYVHDELAYEHDAIGHIKAKTLQRPNINDEHEIVRILKIKT